MYAFSSYCNIYSPVIIIWGTHRKEYFPFLWLLVDSNILRLIYSRDLSSIATLTWAPPSHPSRKKHPVLSLILYRCLYERVRIERSDQHNAQVNAHKLWFPMFRKNILFVFSSVKVDLVQTCIQELHLDQRACSKLQSAFTCRCLNFVRLR